MMKSGLPVFICSTKTKRSHKRGQRKRRTFDYSKEKLGALSEKKAAVYNENFEIIPVI